LVSSTYAFEVVLGRVDSIPAIVLLLIFYRVDDDRKETERDVAEFIIIRRKILKRR
jgi:hypothetical protein